MISGWEEISCNIKIDVRMAKNSHKNRIIENIEFLVSIGDFKLRLSLPKHTTVAGLINIVRAYDFHNDYGPQGMPFVGLASSHTHPLLDYWLTQPSLDFTRFKRRLELRCLYGCERRAEKLSSGEFQYLVCLGKGACGAVYLVRSKITGAVMALKRVEKATIRNYQSLMTQFHQRKNLIRMGSNNHTVNLHACFESRWHFNFLMDYYPGGELFLHLNRREPLLRTCQIKHYFCEILLAMEYIHKKKVLYRDLKPENIFVDVNGHLRIGDFGMSKCDFEEEDFTTSVCGSPEYMAPEVIDNQNYNFSADFYSIGAILYELLTGVPPYYNEADDDQQRLTLIKSMSLQLETVTEDPHLQALLSNLLHPDPDCRISNFQEIKNSPWLSSVDWKAIEQKLEPMPYAPDPSAPLEAYVGKEFLSLGTEVEEINRNCEQQPFSSEISSTFEYVGPESRKVLGLDCLHGSAKPKAKGSLKEKKEKGTKKTNLSVALFEREDTCESICSEPRAKGENKENIGPLPRDRSKKMIVNLSKQGSTIFLAKPHLHDQIGLTARQKSQRSLQIPFSQNASECVSKGGSECGSEYGAKTVGEGRKKGTSRGREMGRGESREGKSKGGRSREKLKEGSVSKAMLRKKEERKVLPTCSFKIKLT